MTDCIVLLKLTLEQPHPVSTMEQTRRFLASLSTAGSDVLKDMFKGDVRELEFEMAYSSKADFQLDGCHQFFNEARSAARDQGKVAYNNRIVTVTFIRMIRS